MMHRTLVSKHRELWGTCSWAQIFPLQGSRSHWEPVSWDPGREGATLGASAGIGAPGLCSHTRLCTRHWQVPCPILAVLSRCCCNRNPVTAWAKTWPSSLAWPKLTFPHSFFSRSHKTCVFHFTLHHKFSPTADLSASVCNKLCHARTVHTSTRTGSQLL